MSKKEGTLFSKTLFGYKKSDVNEYIRIADENNSVKIKECEEKIRELEATLAQERVKSQTEINKLIESNENSRKNAECEKIEYENKLAESEAKVNAYLKLSDDANLKAEIAEAKISDLVATLEAKESQIKSLNEKIDASDKHIKELNSSIALYALREENEKKEQVKYIKFRRPMFFRFIKR